MILNSLEIINCEPISLVEDSGDILISTTKKFRTKLPEIEEEGILVCPIIEKSSILDGDKIVYTQVANFHSLLIVTKDNEEIELKLLDPHKDTPSSKQSHYSIITHIDKFDAFFFDAIYTELLDYWKYFRYEINFQTWVNYERNGIIRPLISFCWNHMIEVQQGKKKWEILSKKSSTRDDVISSSNKNIKSFYDIGNLPHLSTAVKDWKIINGQVKNKPS